MTSETAAGRRLHRLYEDYATDRVDRREFMKQATALGVAGAAAALGPLTVRPAEAAAQTLAATAKMPLDLAEWSYFWVNVRRAETAAGSYVGGQQMYVEYMIPAQVRHPFPLVLVHGGGGQGTDWMGTPDGRPGWLQYLVAEGYKVYVVDRPGHGRAPVHPTTHGGFPPRAATYEMFIGLVTPPTPASKIKPGPYQHLQTQWPGPGTLGSPEMDQWVASQGGSYVQVAAAAPPAAPRAGGPPVPANQVPGGPLPDPEHTAWRQAGAEMLDKIGPAIIITHSASAMFGFIVGEARPALVKANVILEAGGAAFTAGNRWGLSRIPLTYDPPASDPSEIKTVWVDKPEENIAGYFLQAEPPRRLPNLRNTKVLHVTAEASFRSPGNPGLIAFLKQAGVQAEEMRLASLGIRGNGHVFTVEKNNREVLQPIIDWMNTNVTGRTNQAPAVRRAPDDSTALKLADMRIFWVGTERKSMPYGTIQVGQMFVQYFEPAQVRYPYPIVLVHGGLGQGTQACGLAGMSGWAHHYVQAGYKLYLIDRHGHGRAPYHPDALGEIGAMPTYQQITVDTIPAARGPNKRWPGTGDVGDPLLDQFMAGQNGLPRDAALSQDLWRRHGAELIDKIGPAIIQTHSAGGTFGWLVADARPNLVKAVVSFEGSTAPLVVPAGQEARLLPNLRNMPIMYLLSDQGSTSGRFNGGPILEALRRSGAKAEVINLRDRNILGNGHFAMFETNRRQVFEVMKGWIEERVPVTSTARA